MEDNLTTFSSLLEGGNGTWKEATQKDKTILEHDVTNITGDALLDRLIFLSDQKWLGKMWHKFVVSGKNFFKIKTSPCSDDSGPAAELWEVQDKKTRKWSKDFRKVLEGFNDYFTKFLREPLLNHLRVDEAKNMAAISLLFEIARIPGDMRTVNRNDVARAIQVGLSSDKGDADDLVNLFVKDENEKVKSFINIMNRGNKTEFLTQMFLRRNSVPQEPCNPQTPKKRSKTMDSLEGDDVNGPSAHKKRTQKTATSQKHKFGMPPSQKDAVQPLIPSTYESTTPKKQLISPMEEFGSFTPSLEQTNSNPSLVPTPKASQKQEKETPYDMKPHFQKNTAFGLSTTSTGLTDHKVPFVIPSAFSQKPLIGTLHEVGQKSPFPKSTTTVQGAPGIGMTQLAATSSKKGETKPTPSAPIKVEPAVVWSPSNKPSQIQLKKTQMEQISAQTQLNPSQIAEMFQYLQQIEKEKRGSNS